MTVATIEQDGDTLVLRTPFNREFVDELKDMIPPNQRKWDPDEKTWILTNIDALDVVVLMRTHFDAVESDL